MRLTFNLLGPQGSGKGTQARALAQHFDMIHFDAGEALRQIRETGSSLGQEIASYIDGGNRVPPHLIAEVTYETLAKAPTDKDILFDGLLRGLDELEAQRPTFEKLALELPVIIFLNLDEETAIDRIAKRRICTVCGARQIVTDEETLGTCRRCGGQLELRHDDTPEALRQRLSWYYRDTVPVVNYFREQGTVIDIDASPSIEAVTRAVIAQVCQYYQSRGLTPSIRQNG